jgi:hypothetical protein
VADPRDRLETESAALGFFEKNGLGPTPRLHAVDRLHNAVLLEWIAGEPVDVPTSDDIDTALNFLACLHRERGATEAEFLPLASEACLSAGEVESQISRRFSRLAEIAASHFALRDMLEPLTILAAESSTRGRQLYSEANMDWNVDIDPEARTLSPSDFGFHNALRRTDGSLAFLDFEYFGWDDPAKLVCDVLLHPGMALTEPLKLHFLAGTRVIYGADPGFATRIRALYPLFGLRWCAILLNEFLPEKWMVRVHAGESDVKAVQTRQIAKASALLQKLLETDSVVRALYA